MRVDIGGDAFVNDAPTEGAVLNWDQVWYGATPTLSGTLHFDGVTGSCARVRLISYDSIGTELRTDYSGCPLGPALARAGRVRTPRRAEPSAEGGAMLGYEAIAKALADQGIENAFGVVGDGNVFIVDAMVNKHGVHYVAAAHEASATLMATGFTRSTGKLCVATVTHGPGLTNTITPLVEAVRSATPLIVVIGDTVVEAQHHLQKIGQRELVAATGAGFEPIRTPSSIAADVATAVRRAYAENRPIVLNVPYEYEFLEVEYTAAPSVTPASLSLAPDPEALDRAVGLIASAARPIVLAGRGAVPSGAREALVRLAARLGAPLATTLMGNGLFQGEPFNLGIFGTLASTVASDVISKADCVIAFGAGLNYLTTYSGTLLAGKAVVHCDIDASHLGRLSPIDAGIVGDAGRVAETIVSWLDEADHKPSGFRSPELERQLKEFDRSAEFVDKSTDSYLDPRTVTLRLLDLLPADRNVVFDGGRYMQTALIIPATEPRAFVTSTSFGSIGLGMGNAIGTAVGSPQRPTVLVAGDGGFMMGGLVELNTAIQNQLNMIVVIFNDSSYGAEHIQFHNKGMDPALSVHRWPSFAAVANAMGGTGLTINNLAELEAAGPVMAANKGVLLLDIKLDAAMISQVIGGAH